MENNGMKFYQIFGFGGTIAVNGLTFSELIMVNFGTLIVMILLLGVLASIFPILMLFAYAMMVMGGNWEQMQLDRVRVNIFALVGYVYFMFDYHFGFVGWVFFHTMFGAEFVDKLCYINTALFLLNILLIFFGNRIFNQIDNGLVRLAAFGVILFLSSKVLLPIGKALSPAITTQYVPKPGEGIKKDGEEVIDETNDEEEIDGLDKQIQDFERGRGNYNYNYTEPESSDEENVEHYGC
jgi:hypothetical protein